jgi:hypothetical protein
MPSRRKRKRYQRMAEATANSLKSCGGWGQGVPTTLFDLVKLRRAIREGWPVPLAVRQAIVEELYGDLVSSLEGDSNFDFGRFAISRVRCVVEMEGINQAIEIAERAARNAYAAPQRAAVATAREWSNVTRDSGTRPWGV